jgi:hypothetical protein
VSVPTDLVEHRDDGLVAVVAREDVDAEPDDALRGAERVLPHGEHEERVAVDDLEERV